MDQAAVNKWCVEGDLPDQDVLYTAFLKEDGLFDDAEGIQWDFKDQWPFSLSDEYFGGIARLICAFSNSYGGIIVFGVHDKKRSGGHNKVRINLDRFNQALRQLLGSLPPLVLRSYMSETSGDVDVLLVRPRPDGITPYRFNKTIGKYQSGVIWTRVGHEARIAEPSQYPVLFCRARLPAEATEVSPLDGSIPPSPATLKQRFVGRTEVLDQLFHWLEASDEPRTYLHGKGGSGKTTIAYEFARLIKENGGSLNLYGANKLDAVVFITAKETSLAVSEGKIVQNENRDFRNEQELLKSILLYGGWTRDDGYLQSLSLEALRSEARAYLDINSILLVIDDVDTLTTKGIDPGSDFLYRTLCRASRTSKVVYTLRNAPSQSLGNAIEVPALDDEDYDHFVTECVQHFAVPPPTLEFRTHRLSEISERRPLVIESIIALRRTAGTYERATELFQQQTGDAIRDYVFLREWDALPSSTPKLLLAALSEFSEPATFNDLQSVLQFDASGVSDAIGAVREMFLQIDDAGSSTLYALAPLTKAFVTNKRSQLVGYQMLRERVKAYRRHVAVSNPRVANIASQIERLLPTRFQEHSTDKVREAFRLVSDRTLPPFVTEDPFFRTVLGYTLACSSPPRLSDVREAFAYAFSMKFEPDYRYLRAWFAAERNSGVNDGWCLKIADRVLEGKRYSEPEKMEMTGRKGSSLYARAQERLAADPSDALRDLTEALRLHLKAFRLYCNAGDIRANTSERYARGTAFQLFNTFAKSPVPWEYIDAIETISQGKDVYLDPIEDPIREATDIALKNVLRAEALARFRQRLRTVSDLSTTPELWLATDASQRVARTVKASIADAETKQKLLKQPRRN